MKSKKKDGLRNDILHEGTKMSLHKKAISLRLAKKIFDARYVRGMAAKEIASTHSNPANMINRETSLSQANKIVRKNRIVAEKMGDKLDSASNHLNIREGWAKNMKEYGRRNPSIMDKMKHKMSGLSGLIPSGQKSMKPGLAYA